jgi:hypothetical protein
MIIASPDTTAPTGAATKNLIPAFNLTVQSLGSIAIFGFIAFLSM